jgi:UDP-N-acetylglucosamine--N-acetylmuramyl-(pentapeptide) pyrophosphoryl-undecaprenol N-acetylglucosamine transferase
MESRNGTYVLAGGGTGGHVFPAVAVAREIRRRRPEAGILFVGTRGGFEAVIAPKEGFEIEFVRASGFVGKSPGAKISSLFALARGVFEARRILRARKARAVFGVGGYASLPVLLAARFSRVPSMIQEQNSVPGLANRLASRLARRTATGFESASRFFPGPCVFTGNPVREEFFRVAPLERRAADRRVFLFGGSQGSRRLNRALIEAAPHFRDSGISVVAQSGEKEYARLKEVLAAYPNIRVEKFISEMWKELENADLVVSRAGALALAELAAAGRPAILVPFAAATHRHQDENAREFERAGAASVLSESELSGQALAGRVAELLEDPARLRSMGEAARRLARPEAARELADLFLALAPEAA